MKENFDSNILNNILKKIKDLESIRDKRESVWNAIMNAIDPFWEEMRYKYEQYGNRGTQYINGQFSESYKGIFGSLIERATLTLTSQMIDPSLSWLGLKMKNYKDNENIYLKEYLKDLSNWVYGATENYESGFYTSSPIVIGNAFQLGIGSRYCSYSDEDTAVLPSYGYKTALTFESVDPRFFVFDRDVRGNLNFYARKLILSLEDAAGLWGEEVLRTSYSQSDFRNVNLYDVIKKYYHVVIPNFNLKKGSDNRWMELAIDIERREVINIGYICEMPYTVWTFLPESLGNYGKSPAYYLAKNILAAENYSEEIIKAAEYINNPAWFVSKGANPLMEEMVPGARILEAISLDGKPLVTKAPIGDNLPTAAELFRLERAEIAEGLIIRDLSQQYNQAGMTETLVAEQRMAADNQMKPIINRWAAQDLQPTVKFILKYLSKRRKINKSKGKIEYSALVEFPYNELGILPEELEDPVEALGIYYEGMLGRQQDRYEDFMVGNAVMETMQMAQANPEQARGALRNINLDKAVRSKIGLKHFRTDILRTEEELAELDKEDARREQMQNYVNETNEAKEMLGGK